MEPVIITFLEMLSPAQLRPKSSPSADFFVREAKIKRWQINKFFYCFVGGKWSWADKLVWSDEKWQAYAEKENFHTFIAYFQDTPIGYFELEKRGDEVEIKMLGLEPGSVDKGFGGYFLSEALRQSWALGAKRVIVDTCTLDHPNALKNYLARGMTIYKTVDRATLKKN